MAIYYANGAMPSEDELKHFKYIRRYKGSNGEWRYVYAEKEFHDKIDKKQSDAARARRIQYDIAVKGVQDDKDTLARIERSHGKDSKEYREAYQDYIDHISWLADFAMDFNEKARMDDAEADSYMNDAALKNPFKKLFKR